jgi:hypothetical protein
MQIYADVADIRHFYKATGKAELWRNVQQMQVVVEQIGKILKEEPVATMPGFGVAAGAVAKVAGT